MALLDMQTLIVITALVTLLTAILLGTSFKVVPSGIRGHKLWIASFLLYTMSTWLGADHDGISLQSARYFAAIIEAFAGCLLFVGVCQFFNRQIPRQLLLGFVVFELGLLVATPLLAEGDRLLWLALISARGLLPFGIAVVAWGSRNRSRFLSGATLGAIAAFAQGCVVLLYGACELSSAIGAGLEVAKPIYQSAEMALAVVGAIAMIQVVNDRFRDDLEYLASHDALTGTLSRRSFGESFTKELARASRNGRYPSLLMIDVDNFKAINDTHGHANGDLALCAVSQTVTAALRHEDIHGRYGGEEFVVLLPDTQAQSAFEVAERIRRNIEALDLGDSDARFRCTVSIGVAYCVAPIDPEAAFRAADAAMYRAKAAGKNRTLMATAAID